MIVWFSMLLCVELAAVSHFIWPPYSVLLRDFVWQESLPLSAVSCLGQRQESWVRVTLCTACSRRGRPGFTLCLLTAGSSFAKAVLSISGFTWLKWSFFIYRSLFVVIGGESQRYSEGQNKTNALRLLVTIRLGASATVEVSSAAS